MSVKDQLEFLKASDFSVALSQDGQRVARCLVHRNVDVRLAAVKCVASRGTWRDIAELIETFANHESWSRGRGIYPASKCVAPRITKKHGNALADAFPNLADRNETGYQVLCGQCPSDELVEALKGHLFDSASDREVCHLAIKSLSSIKDCGLASVWRHCRGHKFDVVRHCAEVFLHRCGEA